VLDPVEQGLSDLRARRIRFIGDPHDRIREDYLRILRFFRFHAWYADPAEGMDADGLAASAELADGIDRLAKERIGMEMRKLLAAPDPAPAVAAMAQAGVLNRVLPGADARMLPVLVAVERQAPPDALRRLAVLGGAGCRRRAAPVAGRGAGPGAVARRYGWDGAGSR
jgi:poly(A) polymerase